MFVAILTSKTCLSRVTPSPDLASDVKLEGKTTTSSSAIEKMSRCHCALPIFENKFSELFELDDDS